MCSIKAIFPSLLALSLLSSEHGDHGVTTLTVTCERSASASAPRESTRVLNADPPDPPDPRDPSDPPDPPDRPANHPLGPSRYCSPRLRMLFHSTNEGKGAWDDVVGNIRQAPPSRPPRHP